MCIRDRGGGSPPDRIGLEGDGGMGTSHRQTTASLGGGGETRGCWIPTSAPSQYSKGIWLRAKFPFFVFWANVAQMWRAVFFRGILLRRSDPVSGRPWRVTRADSSWTDINRAFRTLSLIHISEPTRLGMISYAVFCLKKNKIINT